MAVAAQHMWADKVAPAHRGHTQRPGDRLWGTQRQRHAQHAPLTPRWQALNKVLPPLPSRESSRYATATVAAGAATAPFAPYQWKPVQLKTHTSFHDENLVVPYFQGVYVNTLSLNLDTAGTEPHELRLAPGVAAMLAAPCCHKLGANLVLCKGVVMVTCPEGVRAAAGWNTRLVKLPRELRPDRPLHFAAISCDAELVAGHDSTNATLVNIIVGPDGWLYGIGFRQQHGAVDLSAVRFCVGKSLSLLDDVRIYLCDVGGGRRFVSLQGFLRERFFGNFKSKPLMALAPALRPKEAFVFVTPGHRAGGFHLLRLLPGDKAAGKSDVSWVDGVWSLDSVHCTGIMYEAAASAMEHEVCRVWKEEPSKVFLREFQMLIIRTFGSIDKAWHNRFDVDGSGDINVTEFTEGCKAAGYVGNPMRLWALLDADGNGDISLEELSAGSEGLAEEIEKKQRTRAAQAAQAIEAINMAQAAQEAEAVNDQAQFTVTALPPLRC